MFKALLYLSLAVFAFGLAFKISTWFRYSIGAQRFTAFQRVSAAAKGIVLTVFSRRIFTLFKVFVLDVLLQCRALRQDPFRWVMHMLIFGGFTVLLLMHALENFTMAVLVPNYCRTLNPFLFLRDLFGSLTLLGVALAVYRRFFRNAPRPATNAMDVYTMVIVAVVLASGIVLEGVKIMSHSVYQDMVEEYAGPLDEPSLRALEAYWVNDFGVVSPRVSGPFAPEILAEGKAVNAITCQQCHAPAQWAFMGYGASRVMTPLAAYLSGEKVRTILYWLHFLACLFGLAYLPFSKMFHAFSSPLSLLANAVMDRTLSDPANIATRQIIELDACTHCGTCTLQCSVAFVHSIIPNSNILPSEKIASIRALARGERLSVHELMIIQNGLNLCTNCYQCTAACPVGINLQDLWFSVREVLFLKNIPELMVLSPLSFYRGMRKESIDPHSYQKPLDLARAAIVNGFEGQTQEDQLTFQPEREKVLEAINLPLGQEDFHNCFACMSCTNGCPVVKYYENPAAELGLLPHQIMHAVGLSLWEPVLSSKMLWDCLGCYQCQEYCPMKVPVAELIFLLRNVAVSGAMYARSTVV
jgi:heterodisulfide reductase subunit C/nitrate reductase gamma subunit